MSVAFNDLEPCHEGEVVEDATRLTQPAARRQYDLSLHDGATRGVAPRAGGPTEGCPERPDVSRGEAHAVDHRGSACEVGGFARERDGIGAADDLPDVDPRRPALPAGGARVGRCEPGAAVRELASRRSDSLP